MNIAIGDRIQGHCVAWNLSLTGRVVEVLSPDVFHGDVNPHYRVDSISYLDAPETWSTPDTAIICAD
jgi:hypothetical protein